VSAADLQDTPEESAFRAAVRAFLEARLERRGAESRLSVMGSADDRVDEGRRLLEQLDEGGWAAPTWPAEHGGRAATATQAAIFHQELARFETPDLYPFLVGISLVGPTLLAHGSPGQQARWLPTIRTGEEIWCQLFSEPNAGSDLAALEARATRDGDEWRVTGQKVWSSRAHYSEWGLLLARTDPTVPKHAGITAFALDMRVPGVEVRPLRQMNGDAHFNEVFMTDAPVRDADRIGGVGDGWRVAITTLMHERSAIGGGGGVTRARLIELARARGATDDPLVRQRLADVIMRLDVDRATAMRARAATRAGRPPGPEGSGAKLRMGATLKAMADLALDLHGPEGVAFRAASEAGAGKGPVGGDNDWHRLFLTAPSISIRGGTDEVQRNIVGERVLGLPPEPRPDKGAPFNRGRATGGEPSR
jgi:alkylation response protein AidB-like acyl-CoA dehydrogenase